jgi:hypothetical protein
MGSESAEEQASITIRRKSPEDVQQRQIIVKLDGENVGELYYGDTISIRVTAGRHKLRVDNTWNWKTVELDVVPGDHLKFQTMSRAGRFSWFLVSLLGAGPI